MQDYLRDIVRNTHGLGIIDLVKITGTITETVIEAIAEDRTVIVQAKTNKPVSEFIGMFGMPNLSKLSTILGIPEYKDDAKISLTMQDKDGTQIASGLHFENKAGDFKNDYRFMAAEIVGDRLKSVKFKGANWNVEFHPTAINIQRLKFQAQANSDETTFTAKTEGTDLKLFFGDHSSHAGNFVFQNDIKGSLTKGWNWPVSAVISILSLPGDKVFRISDDGAAQITVDSGLATYNYILPAMTK